MSFPLGPPIRPARVGPIRPSRIESKKQPSVKERAAALEAAGGIPPPPGAAAAAAIGPSVIPKAAAPAAAAAAAAAAPAAAPAAAAAMTVAQKIAYAQQQALHANGKAHSTSITAEKAEEAFKKGDFGKARRLAEKVMVNVQLIKAETRNSLDLTLNFQAQIDPAAKQETLRLIGEANALAKKVETDAQGILDMTAPDKMKTLHGRMVLMGPAPYKGLGTRLASGTKGTFGTPMGFAAGLVVGVASAVFYAGPAYLLTGGKDKVSENPGIKAARDLITYGPKRLKEVYTGEIQEQILGGVAPEHEAAYREATHTEGEVNPLDPTTIAAYFEKHRNQVSVDAAYNVHFLTDTTKGKVYIEDRTTTPPTYRSFSASDVDDGSPITDSKKLFEAARIIITTIKSSDENIKNCFQSYDIVTFNLQNKGDNQKPQPAVKMKGFHYDRDATGAFKAKQPLLKYHLNESLAGVTINVEKKDVDAMGRIFGLGADKDTLSGQKKSSSVKDPATTKAPDAPAGMQLVKAYGDGECGYRALEMGTAANFKVLPTTYEKDFNDPKDLSKIAKSRRDLAQSLQDKFNRIQAVLGPQAPKEQVAPLLIGMLGTVKGALAASPTPALTKLEKHLSQTLENIENNVGLNFGAVQKSIIDPFNAILLLPATSGGFQADEFTLKLFAETHKLEVIVHKWNGSKFLSSPPLGTATNGTINLKYSGSGAAGHYDLLIPEVASAKKI